MWCIMTPVLKAEGVKYANEVHATMKITQFSYQSWRAPLSPTLCLHTILYKNDLGGLPDEILYDWCGHRNSEPLDNLSPFNLCQHFYFVATATAHHSACSSSVGWHDSKEWLHVLHSQLFRSPRPHLFSLCWMIYSNKQGIAAFEASASCACAPVKGYHIWTFIILQAVFYLCAHAVKAGEAFPLCFRICSLIGKHIPQPQRCVILK